MTLFELLCRVRAGIWGPSGGKGQMQPLIRRAGQAGKTLRFIISARTDLAQAVNPQGGQNFAPLPDRS